MEPSFNLSYTSGQGNFSNSNMSNSSYATNNCSGSDFTALTGLLPLLLLAAFVFNALMVAALILSTSVAIQVRVLLIHLLVAILLSATLALVQLVVAVGVSSEPPLHFCRFSIWVYGVTVQARVCGLVVFSMMVFQIVRHGMRQIGAKWLIGNLVGSWLISLISPIHIFIPPTDQVKYVECKACFTRPYDGEFRDFRLIYIFIRIVVGYFLPLLICFCILLGILCYIKRHTISEAEYKLAKFAAFLIPGCIVNILGQVVIPIIVFSTGLPVAQLAGVYLAYIMIILSFFPTPILTFIYLKSFRQWLCRIFCGKCRQRSQSSPMHMQQAETQL